MQAFISQLAILGVITLVTLSANATNSIGIVNCKFNTYNLTLQSRFVNSSSTEPSSYCSGRLAIHIATNNTQDDLADSACNLSNFSRLHVTVTEQSRSEYLPPVVDLLRTAAAVSRLQYAGPGRLLSMVQPEQSLTSLTHLSAACHEQYPIEANFALIGGQSKLNRLIEVQLHACVRRSSQSVLLNNLAALISAKYIGGKINRLSSGELSELPNLNYLYLVNCDLESISVGAFDDLKALLHLSLTGSPRLRLLAKGLFRHQGSLQRLSLRNNGLEELTQAFLDSPTNRLESLDLGHNKLERLPADGFKGLGRLRELLLDGNKLLKLADKPCLALCSLTSLRTLKLDAEINEIRGSGGTVCSRLALNSSATVQLLTKKWPIDTPRLRCPAVPGGADWCRLETRLLQAVGASGDQKQEEHLQQQQLQQQQNFPSLILLLIFGAICLAHLTLTGALACLCWRARHRRPHQHRRRRQGQLTAKAIGIGLTGDAAGSCSRESDGAGVDTPNGSGGGLMAASSSESAAAVLISFRSRPNDAHALGNDYEAPVDLLPPREKTCYEFNEDA